MPSFTARCMLWAALFAGAFVVLDAACPALAVKLRAPTQVHAGKALNYRIRVTLPQKSGLINATTLQLDLPLANEVQTIHVTPKNSDVTVRTVGSTTYFEGMREAKRYNFKVKVLVDKCASDKLSFELTSYNTVNAECQETYPSTDIRVKPARGKTSPCTSPQETCLGGNVTTAVLGNNSYELQPGGYNLSASCALLYSVKIFKFVPAQIGNYSFSTCGSIYVDQIMSVSAGCNTTDLACIDDSCACAPGGCGGSAYAQTIIRSLAAGVPIYVNQGGYSPIIAGGNNTGVLSIALVDANIATSTNDVFSDTKPDKHQK